MKRGPQSLPVTFIEYWRIFIYIYFFITDRVDLWPVKFKNINCPVNIVSASGTDVNKVKQHEPTAALRWLALKWFVGRPVVMHLGSFKAASDVCLKYIILVIHCVCYACNSLWTLWYIRASCPDVTVNLLTAPSIRPTWNENRICPAQHPLCIHFRFKVRCKQLFSDRRSKKTGGGCMHGAHVRIAFSTCQLVNKQIRYYCRHTQRVDRLRQH